MRSWPAVAVPGARGSFGVHRSFASDHVRFFRFGRSRALVVGGGHAHLEAVSEFTDADFMRLARRAGDFFAARDGRARDPLVGGAKRRRPHPGAFVRRQRLSDEQHPGNVGRADVHRRSRHDLCAGGCALRARAGAVRGGDLRFHPVADVLGRDPVGGVGRAGDGSAAVPAPDPLVAVLERRRALK